MSSRFFPLLEGTISDFGPLTVSVGFELLGSDLGKDVESAIQYALSDGGRLKSGRSGQRFSNAEDVLPVIVVNALLQRKSARCARNDARRSDGGFQLFCPTSITKSISRPSRVRR